MDDLFLINDSAQPHRVAGGFQDAVDIGIEGLWINRGHRLLLIVWNGSFPHGCRSLIGSHDPSKFATGTAAG